MKNYEPSNQVWDEDEEEHIICIYVLIYFCLVYNKRKYKKIRKTHAVYLWIISRWYSRKCAEK